MSNFQKIGIRLVEDKKRKKLSGQRLRMKKRKLKGNILRVTYMLILSDTIEAEEIRTIIKFASDQVINTLSPPTLMALIESKMTRFLPILS